MKDLVIYLCEKMRDLSPIWHKCSAIRFLSRETIVGLLVLIGWMIESSNHLHIKF